MNWKLVVSHACALLLAGAVAGILEIQPESRELRHVVVSYLVNADALFLVLAGIYANLAYRTSSGPWFHAIAAAMLSELAARGLLLLFSADSLGSPLSLVVFDYVMSLSALLLGTFAGLRLRQTCRAAVEQPPLRESP